jgi:Arm DNA-binding domain
VSVTSEAAPIRERKQRKKQPFTDARVDKLLPKRKRWLQPDPDVQIAHYVAVQPSGKRSFYWQARDPITRKQARHCIGHRPQMGIVEARERAGAAIANIKAGGPPVKPPQPAGCDPK